MRSTRMAWALWCSRSCARRCGARATRRVSWSTCSATSAPTCAGASRVRISRTPSSASRRAYSRAPAFFFAARLSEKQRARKDMLWLSAQIERGHVGRRATGGVRGGRQGENRESDDRPIIQVLQRSWRERKVPHGSSV